jgi:hypothetical protein
MLHDLGMSDDESKLPKLFHLKSDSCGMCLSTVDDVRYFQWQVLLLCHVLTM